MAFLKFTANRSNFTSLALLNKIQTTYGFSASSELRSQPEVSTLALHKDHGRHLKSQKQRETMARRAPSPETVS